VELFVQITTDNKMEVEGATRTSRLVRTETMSAADVFTLVVQWLRAFHEDLPVDVVQTIFDFSGIHAYQLCAENGARHRGRDSDETNYLRAQISQQRYFVLRSLKVVVSSKDQGWGNTGPYSWMEFVVGNRNEFNPRLLENGRTNDFVRTVREFDADHPEFQKIVEYMRHNNNNQHHDDDGTAPIALVACSKYPGWRCIVEEASIECLRSPNVLQIAQSPLALRGRGVL
jgi:hypothetical protein